MSVKIARKLADIAPFRVMELLDRAQALEQQGYRLVHLEVGEPDFVTAAPIVAAAKQALDDGQTKYTSALGLPQLRAAIAEFYQQQCGLTIDPERIVVTSGASGGLLLLAALLLNPEDRVILPDPGYPCNEVFMKVVGAQIRRVAVRAEAGYQLTIAALSSQWTPDCRSLLLASPANPTGSVLSADRLRQLTGWVAEQGGFTILDEIYQGLVYDTPGYHSGLQVVDDLWVVNSFSKYFGMTGWRLGWLVLPPQSVAVGAITEISKLAQNLFISPSTIAQYAALAAFSPAAVAIHEQRREVFAERRDRLLAGLVDLGFKVTNSPAGAFYIYADISTFGMNAEDFCWRLVNEFHVAVTPGVDFGDHESSQTVRFSYTTDMDSIELGLQRIDRALTSWGCACS